MSIKRHARSDHSMFLEFRWKCNRFTGKLAPQSASSIEFSPLGAFPPIGETRSLASKNDKVPAAGDLVGGTMSLFVIDELRQAYQTKGTSALTLRRLMTRRRHTRGHQEAYS